MSNFRIGYKVTINNEIDVKKGDLIKIELNTGEIIKGSFMFFEQETVLIMTILRKGIYWHFDVNDIEKIEIMEG